MAMTFQLKDFDGPLDLLLFLINKEKSTSRIFSSARLPTSILIRFAMRLTLIWTTRRTFW